MEGKRRMDVTEVERNYKKNRPPDPLPCHRRLRSPKGGGCNLIGKLASAGVRTVGGCEVSWTSHTCFRDGRTQQYPEPGKSAALGSASPLWSCFTPVGKGEQEGKGGGGGGPCSLADLWKTYRVQIYCSLGQVAPSRKPSSGLPSDPL